MNIPEDISGAKALSVLKSDNLPAICEQIA
jgi:hypothetical protein